MATISISCRHFLWGTPYIYLSIRPTCTLIFSQSGLEIDAIDLEKGVGLFVWSLWYWINQCLRSDAKGIMLKLKCVNSSLLHRPLFTQFFTPDKSLFPSTRHDIISSFLSYMYYHLSFLGCHGSRS